MIGVFQFQAVRQRQKVPTLVEERPEVRPIAPTQLIQDGFIDFKRHIEYQRQVLMEEQAGEIGILRFQVKFILWPPVFEERKPRRADGDVEGLIYLLVSPRLFLFRWSHVLEMVIHTPEVP
jgi:hypothetical protein